MNLVCISLFLATTNLPALSSVFTSVQTTNFLNCICHQWDKGDPGLERSIDIETNSNTGAALWLLLGVIYKKSLDA